MTTKAILLRIPEDLLKKLDKQATKEMRTRQNLIIVAISAYLDRAKQN
jgi:metal-responsive CopG/Arc/MetJ family transcriptional regulator